MESGNFEPFDLRTPPRAGVLDKVPWSIRLLAAAAFAFFAALLISAIASR
jgi:hypothetical protein